MDLGGHCQTGFTGTRQLQRRPKPTPPQAAYRERQPLPRRDLVRDHSCPNPGDNDGQADDCEADDEADNKSTQVHLRGPLDLDVRVGEKFPVIKPVGLGAAFLHLGPVFFRVGIDRRFHCIP